MKRVFYWIVYYFWVCIPAGMGMPPFHRMNRLFSFEDKPKDAAS